MPDPMTPPVPAEAVARLTKALDGVPDTERVCVTDKWDRVVLFVSETPGKLRDIYVRDLREVLAAYADAARDRERFRNYGDHTETCDSWGGVSTDPSGCSCGFNAAWYAAFPEDRVADAARTGEAR